MHAKLWKAVSKNGQPRLGDQRTKSRWHPWSSKTAGRAWRMESLIRLGECVCQRTSLNTVQQSCAAGRGIMHADAMKRSADGGRMTGAIVGACSDGWIRRRSSCIEDAMARKRSSCSRLMAWRDGLLATMEASRARSIEVGVSVTTWRRVCQ
jgi:hypothetical protein